MAVVAALSLYLNLINIFQLLLQFYRPALGITFYRAADREQK
jgi:hypothetical protein